MCQVPSIMAKIEIFKLLSRWYTQKPSKSMILVQQEDTKEDWRRFIRVPWNFRASKMTNIQSLTTILWFQAKSQRLQPLWTTVLKGRRNRPLTEWFIAISSHLMISLRTISTALKVIILLQIRLIELAEITCPKLQIPTYKRLTEVLKSTRQREIKPDFTRKRGQSHLKLKISRT